MNKINLILISLVSHTILAADFSRYAATMEDMIYSRNAMKSRYEHLDGEKSPNENNNKQVLETLQSINKVNKMSDCKVNTSYQDLVEKITSAGEDYHNYQRNIISLCKDIEAINENLHMVVSLNFEIISANLNNAMHRINAADKRARNMAFLNAVYEIVITSNQKLATLMDSLICDRFKVMGFTEV
jgi:predicted phage tail protein